VIAPDTKYSGDEKGATICLPVDVNAAFTLSPLADTAACSVIVATPPNLTGLPASTPSFAMFPTGASTKVSAV